MINMNYKIAVLAVSFCCAGGMAGYAQDYSTQNNNDQQSAVQPDNTRVNESDRNANALTADQQEDNQSDRSITQRIRKAIVGDKSLSVYAHNVKVITHGGVVTLKGPVRSDREKNVIVQKAVDVTGSADKVTDQISVKNQNHQNNENTR